MRLSYVDEGGCVRPCILRHGLHFEYEIHRAGTAKELQEVLINGVYYMLYSTADGLFDFAYVPVNDDQCAVICFGAASADVDRAIAVEILGTIYAVE